MPTWAWIVLAVLLVPMALIIVTIARAKSVVATIKFHEQMASEIAQILREAMVFTPRVTYFTRPDDYGWLTIYVVDSPDAMKFVKSVQAQVQARSRHGIDCQCPPEASG